MASLPTILLILAALSAGALVIAILVAFRSQREAQSAIFPIVREEESVRAHRARLSIFIWVAITALFFGGWLATLRLTESNNSDTPQSNTASDETVNVDQPVEVNRPTEVAAQVPATETLIPAQDLPATAEVETEMEQLASELTPTDTPVPQPLPTLPPEPTEPPPPTSTTEPPPTFTATPLPPTDTPIPPTDTPTPVPPTETSTPTPVLSIGQFPTSAPRTPAPQGAKMGPIQFAEDVTENIQPVNPGDVFANGIPAVYAIFPFKGIPSGIPAKVVWYKNGTELEQEEAAWPWGEKGQGFMFILPRGPGLYKLELYVNDSVLATGLFEVR